MVGASGYGGGELVRLLAEHPHVDLTYVTSNTYEGQSIRKALPGTAKRLAITFEPFHLVAATDRCDCVFLAGESGLAMRLAPGLLEHHVKVIDLSADFRLTDPAVFTEWYKSEHTAVDTLKSAVYGLPELNRQRIRAASLIANPGCYPTSAILAVAPLLKNDLVDTKSIIVDSMSGVSGAGRSKFGLDLHFSEVNDSVKAYGVGGKHRHTPEIEQVLTSVSKQPVTITFTPHLIPVTRGILTTAYANLTGSYEQVRETFADAYAHEPFVYVHEEGEFPATKHVQASNACHIGLCYDSRTGRVIVVSAIDNLIKGAAGQAVQNMNIMSNFEETAGLSMPSVWP